MALILDRTPAGEPADDAADDALQVVDLDDIVISSIEGPPPAHLHRPRRVTLRKVVRLVLAFVFGLALSMPIVAVVRWVQGDDDGSRVDIEDRRRELPDLEPPVRDDDPPLPEVDSPPTTAADDAAPEAAADPGGKAAFKDAARRMTPPATAPTASTTIVPTTATTVPPTTAATTTTTPSVTLPDGSPNPLGPGPSGTSTSMPDPQGPDYSVPG
jgi:hypothetical protein